VFGKTLPELAALMTSPHHIYEKNTFPMYNQDCQNIIETNGYQNRKTAVIYGIEAHICVQQTVLELLRNGK
jgi:nicotinamidase-related amidase